jgi:GntR family transcriptional repressor for pyruvate dehydrogenase complex
MSKKPLSSKPIKKQTLADQMAGAIRQAILSGELESGAALPIEPDLAEQFGVSRAVVRDATRILMAQGLVEVKHGRGVFVTPPQNAAFGEALLLALRRAGATVWDVEQFEQIIFPEVVALAAATASDEEIAGLRRLTAACLEEFARLTFKWRDEAAVPEAELEPLRAAYRELIQAIFAATHNHVFRQLAGPLSELRNLRSWRGEEDFDPETAIKTETDFLNQWVEAIAARDPDRARATVARMMRLPEGAIEVMRRTPVGAMPVIPAAYRPRSSD